MKPIQLWLPTLTGGAARPSRQRDLRRLHAEWDGHHVIWTKPGWNGPPVWMEGRLKVGCISGEELECFRILHIGARGGIAGPAAAAFGELSVGALLNAWFEGEVRASRSSGHTEFEVNLPTAVEGGVACLPTKVHAGLAGRFPFKDLIRGSQKAVAQWPPNPHDPKPVSPESEVSERSSDGSSGGTLILHLQWNEPLHSLMPFFSTEDDLFARDKMRSLRELAMHDIEAARRSAAVDARDWLVEGTSTIDQAWLQPLIAVEGELDAVIAIQYRFDVKYESLSDIYDDARLRAALRKPTGVRRVLGNPGLMWALLLDQLEKGASEKLCNTSAH